jgi:hypothetical protein
VVVAEWEGPLERIGLGGIDETSMRTGGKAGVEVEEEEETLKVGGRKWMALGVAN